MDSQTLRTFITLAHSLNFSQTAQTLFVSQSTVTKRIAELEKELHKSLFLRDKRHVELTDSGQLFLKYAERFISLEDSCLMELNSYESYSTRLRLGTTISIYECHLFPLINKFEQSSNTASIYVSLSHSKELIESLQDGTLDLIFSFTPYIRKGYECCEFKNDTLVLTTSYDNTEFQNGIHKQDLTKMKYLMCNFTLEDDGKYIRSLFPEHYQFKFEIDNSSKLIPYLITGNGYSFLPEKMIEPHLKSKKLRIIPLLNFETPVLKSYYIGKISNRDLWSQLL